MRLKILVTGTAGFVGFHTAKRLLERGDSVVGFDVVNDYYDPTIKEARLKILAETAAKLGIELITIFKELAGAGMGSRKNLNSSETAPLNSYNLIIQGWCYE